MAKMFYSAKEAAQKLGKTEDQLKSMVRNGTLREFRDAGQVNYKVEDIDSIAGPADSSAEPADSSPGDSDTASSSASGILLEPVEDSSIELSPSGSDIVSLEESDAGGTVSGTTAAGRKAKEDTVVPSVGVNVFDDDELDEHVDPLAQTAVSDLAGLGMEGTGSGSGILDLTRESDDTSLGRELLDEIYTGEEEGDAASHSDIQVGEGTQAGIAGAATDEAGQSDEGLETAALTDEGRSRVTVREVVEYGPDPVSSSLTALMAVAIVVMLFGGLAVASLVQGVTPGLLQTAYEKLWMFAAGALLVGAIAGAVTFLMAKRAQ